MKNVIIFSAPSGSGKSTIIHDLLTRHPELRFSISATSRAPRGEERDGVDYHFLAPSEFARRVEAQQFIEWEEVYTGTCYGTLKAEIQRIWDAEQTAVFDVDVVGGVNLKRIFGDQALSIFIMPPSIQELKNRLIGRNTDSDEAIERRIEKAASELEFASKFDKIVINDSLSKAIDEVEEIIANVKFR